MGTPSVSRIPRCVYESPTYYFRPMIHTWSTHGQCLRFTLPWKVLFLRGFPGCFACFFRIKVSCYFGVNMYQHFQIIRSISSFIFRGLKCRCVRVCLHTNLWQYLINAFEISPQAPSVFHFFSGCSHVVLCYLRVQGVILRLRAPLLFPSLPGGREPSS